MDNHELAALSRSALFSGIGESEITEVLGCLSAVERRYERNASILRAGETVLRIGIVLTGSVTVSETDYQGNRSIIGRMEAGESFAESFPFAEERAFPYSVTAAERSRILFIRPDRLVRTCASSCGFHRRLIGNMLRILACRNVALTRKMGHISKRTTRAKLMSYLSAQAVKAKSRSFTIPFNRQELADFLFVDRSALSTELGKLRDEGVISFSKSSFELL
jgi:CRP-like cAMP-binding protein